MSADADRAVRWMLCWSTAAEASYSAKMQFDPFIACGLLGAGCFMVAYLATLQGWVTPADWRFPTTNLLGALLVLVSLYDAWNLPSVVIETFWALISVYGLLRNRPGA